MGASKQSDATVISVTLQIDGGFYYAIRRTEEEATQSVLLSWLPDDGSGMKFRNVGEITRRVFCTLRSRVMELREVCGNPYMVTQDIWSYKRSRGRFDVRSKR